MSVRFGLDHRRPVVFSGLPRPSFDLLFADLGAGAVSVAERFGAPATFTRATIAQALLGNANAGTFGQVAIGTARSWWANNGLSMLGYMAEGARRQACVQSQNFGADWVAIGTPTRAGGTTVLGTIQLDTIGDDDPAALEGYSLPVTFVGDAVKSCGCFMKAGTSTSSVVRLRDGTAAADVLLAVITWAGGTPTVAMTTGTDLTGTVSAAQLGTSGVFWIKFSTTAVTAANANQLEIYPATDAALNVGATGTVQIGGINEEDGTFPSSPIITTGAAITRNADVLTYPFTANSGTLFCQFAENVLDTTANKVLVEVSDTTANNRINLLVDTAHRGTLFVINGGVAQANINGTSTISAATSAKVAAAFNTNDYAISLKGETPATTASGALPTVTTMNVGIREGGSLQSLFGTISRTTYWRPAFRPNILQALTR